MKKKCFRRIVLLLCVIFSLSILSVSAESDKSKVEKTIKNLMSYSENYNTKKIKSLFTNPKNVKLFESNKYMQKTIKAINSEYLSFDIDSIKINGKKATVKLTTWNYPMRSAWYESIRYCIYDYGPFDKNLMTHVAGYAYGMFLSETFENDLPDLKELSVTLQMKKSGSKWKFTNFPMALNNTIHSCYQAAYNEYFD